MSIFCVPPSIYFQFSTGGEGDGRIWFLSCMSLCLFVNFQNMYELFSLCQRFQNCLFKIIFFFFPPLKYTSYFYGIELKILKKSVHIRF